MTYEATLKYLFSQLPMYQRQGKAAYKADLNNTWALMDILKDPYKNFKSVHVAGTNGKGSCSHMLASIMQEAGYKVGLYTSPHLLDFRERIKINGQMIPEMDVIDFVQQNKSEFESINLSFFEWTVGLAFNYFSQEKVDVAIIETGMGGRLDSTNVIDPLISIITNISLDHTQYLGNTLTKIATEKAGIIKENTTVIIGENNTETKAVFHSKAKEVNAPIIFAQEQNFDSIFPSDLLGSYQLKNQKTVRTSIPFTREKGFNISENQIAQGLKNVCKNTGLVGRWQILSNPPLTICDTAHNQSGLEEVLNQIKLLTFQKAHFVLGMVNDKSIDNILPLFPKSATYYFCKASIPRALDSSSLKKTANKFKLNGKDCGSVKNAIKLAFEKAEKDDLVFIGGSTFVVADALAYFN